jgi:rhodanese-related sulfurtransferase
LIPRLIEFANHHPWLVGAAALALLVVLAYEARLRASSAASVSPQELIRLMNQGALVLDLRKQQEFAAGHIGGARQMDSGKILDASESLKKHKEKLLVVYCDTGSVGGAAARQLTAQGFKRALNLRGGLNAWRAENLPVTKD